ncbi:type I-E CRISPR-associated protein Cse2/CasB [Geodermatophilus sp. DF01_2]|uniref:type I-E CRISPR-associated protein Cse2/CasB n=1 Tax=Geodermatophilus sp. DF01-2 TaxID=2559610 RepID=UPI001FD82B13|nr:type I-E CRISPR-associated protein Cse2/CasB [Geodermatophilus sp. DF01_2]
MTSDAPERPADVRRVPLRRLGALVDGRVRDLQGRYRRNQPTGVSDLAALRRASTAAPGSDPRVWEMTVAGLDVPAGTSDEPTDDERAVHAALTLYAIHQQSQTASMHHAGYGLGRSVRALVQPDRSNEKAVRRRFEALGTASTFVELMDHARGLVRQLRSAAVPLDYGRLADDLAALQDPATAAGVRLRWGREYHRARPADAAGATSAAQTEPPTDLEENA